MNYKIKIFILLMLFLPLAPVSAAFDVVFEKEPPLSLFSEASIMPGDSVTRYIKIFNTDDFARNTGIWAYNVEDDDNLSEQMSMEIKRVGDISPVWTGTLKEFLSAGLINLPDLPANSETRYDLNVYFFPETGNDYQLKSVKFDIDVGSDSPGETETVPSSSSGGGGGGGGGPVFLFNKEIEDDIIVAGEEGAPYLDADKSVGAEFANPGAKNVPYTIIITNNSVFPAFEVVVSDILPKGFVFSTTGFNTRSWAIGDLDPGEIKKIEYTVDIDKSVPSGYYRNDVTVVALNNDPIYTSTGLEIREISVKGEELSELDPSGFNVKEMCLVILAILINLLFISKIRRSLKSA